MRDRKRILPIDKDGPNEEKSTLTSRRSLLRAATGLATAGLLVGQATAGSERWDHTLEIVSTEELTETSNGLDVEYQFTTRGEVTPVHGDGNMDADTKNDTVTQNDDGTWTVRGTTGNGFGDTYYFNGAVLAFSCTGPHSLRLDGQAVTTDELVDTGTVEFALASLTEHFTSYTVEVTSAVEPAVVTQDNGVEDRLLAESDDTVSHIEGDRYRIEGQTGTASGEPPAYGDTFRWEPTDDSNGIVGFGYSDADASDLVISINGTSVDPGALPSLETGPVIGGGDGYENTVPPSEATVTVSDRRQLIDAVQSSAAGDVIYVESGVTIDAGLGDFHVPDGVTLASDRGIDGAPGGRIEFTEHLWPQMTVGSDVRLSGLRIHGIDMEYHGLTRPRNVGVETRGSGVEIDNCDIGGFRGAAVRASADTHIHHCYIHDNPMDGLGYGVSCHGGHPVVEYCRLNANRHSIMSSGKSGYTARYNVFGDTAHGIPIDIHSPGNGRYDIHHNTVRADTWPGYHASRDYSGDESMPAMQVRGEPDDARTHANWFHNPNEPAVPADGYGPEAIVKADPSDWGAVGYDGNHYGSGEPDSSIGHPR